MTSTPRLNHAIRPTRRCAAVMAAIGLGLATLSGCASSPSRPTTPVYNGNQRPDPTLPGRPAPPSERQSSQTTDPRRSGTEHVRRGDGAVPRHLIVAGGVDKSVREQLTHIAVLLPFSSANEGARKEAEGILSGVEMALFDAGMPNVILLPKDTGGSPDKAEQAAREALAEGADVVIGPLFSSNVQAVSRLTRQVNVPVLSFTSDLAAAGGSAYLISIPPEEEIARIVDWAALNGVTQFAMFGPDNPYGRRVETALRKETALRGASLFRVERYQPTDPSPTTQARSLAQSVRAADDAHPGQVAVVIPEHGTRLRAVAPLLPYFDVDIKRIKLLGTGLWNSPEVWREPSLKGGAFAAPDPAPLARFRQDFRAAEGDQPSDLSSVGYDAALMALVMLQEDSLNRASIERPDGFLGVNGLFRLRQDGTVERGLAVLQVTGNGDVTVIDPAPRSFSPDGM